MSEFFLELFSEEIPSRLQINARNDLIQIFKKFFDDNEVIIKGKINIYSIPNRLIVYINKISKEKNQFETDEELFEKFAREEYLMKKKSEDIFYIIKE